MAHLDAHISWDCRFHKPLLRRMRMAIGIRKPVRGRLCRFSVPLLLAPRIPVSRGRMTLLLEPWPDLYRNAMARRGQGWTICFKPPPRCWLLDQARI